MISGRGRGKIRPPRRGISHGSDEFEDMWAILQSALREIHEKNASKLSFEQLYRASYKIVLKKQGDRLYDRVKEFEEQWFGSQVMPTIRKLITSNLVNITIGGVSGTTANERRVTGEEFLKGLKASWEDHNTVMNMTTDVLMYMDRVYCQDFRKASIFTTSMGLFRDHILRSRLASSDQDLITFDILNSVILDQISMEREGDVINKHLIRSCMYMLEGLYETDNEKDYEKLYLSTFEPAFIQASRTFYQEECNNLLREGDASSWLKRTKKRFAEEEDRCQTTISLLTTSKIARVIENEMIREHLPEFLAMEGSGIKAMIENDRYEDLTLLYQHISRIDQSKEILKVALQARVVELGSEINKNIQNTEFAQQDVDVAEGGEKSKSRPMNAAAKATVAAIKWVDEVLRLKDKFDTMWRKCFAEDLILQTVLTRSFSDFINIYPRCSEHVSLFIDDNLKRGIKGKTEAEIDEVLDKAVTLLRYIQDKDMFELYYKKHLARRLLFGKSESGDVEKQMVSRMKLEIGNAFTSKLEGMFKDMTMSEELSSGYREHMDKLGDLSRTQPDLGINVLTSNFWPMDSIGGNKMGEDGSRQMCQFPQEILTLQESFKNFYLKERSGRLLTWVGYLGTADIRCTFPPIPGKEGAKVRRHEITFSTFGMIILLLFNDLADGETLSFEEIQERTNMTTQDLARQLHPLAVNPKTKVLNKQPNPKEAPKPGDTFSFNASFTSKNIKLKAPVISAVSKVEGEEERKETEDRNDEHRGNVIDTVIVRIMKARKEFTHQNLFAEVISQLSQRFKPDLNMMKRRVESLIEREYLERVEEANTPTYRYLA
ncbi:Cullin-3 [Hyphodiscus hymeniophilus]|uniref:Cullin-3 n=1 Tax=Hyphodiscus hymeniophilus TaxID=353542 RepID=A0A9P6VNB2_9HELO|nr:Cullin-3 [Hyphodiscus hymeniophilus]